ncbi:caspase family protein [Paraburkholderia sp. CNPSo 3272]|uniref:caspase family protein n=1 Tax=Paraburkholderia sp. CNPSo 3272 TaxID=2940931 RepID=UPI0020B6DF4A|nr:caspase family protein [Paraburkholderia sp. CNPSo 3272]MCP3727117.1 caspase family protein [Paraburkholderia sp. CNPSo 3272]
MTQIFQRAPGAAPATHAFVIGCGRFPELGEAATRQSTVAGARAIVRYLLDHQDELTAPLASIECLLSDPDADAGADQLDIGKFANDPRADDGVSAATRVNVETAGNAWLARCRPNDSMFFYMSSHGVAEADLSVSGLLEDVLTNPFNQWGASLNIGNLATNLPVIGASACWVFLDACQELVDSVLSEYDGLDGVVLVKAKFGKIASTRVRSLALAGSRFGQLAWGPDSRDPPYFTQALLRSFEACVDRDSNGAWVVTGERLLCNVPKVADAAFGYSTLDVEALTKFANQATLVTVPHARIPVVVRTDNLADMAYLTLIEASDGLTFIQSAPLQTNCFLEVAPTGTEFEARPTFSGAQAYRPAKFHANPCAQIVRLLP